MADTYVPPTKPSFDFGRVLTRTFSVIRDNLIPFGIGSLLIIGLPYFLINLIPAFTGVYSTGMIGGDIPDNFLVVVIGVAVLAAIVMALGSFVLQAAIIHTSVKSFGGEKVDFGQSIRLAFRFLLPIIGFGLLSGLGIMGGMLLLIIPGIILALMWCVGIPAMVVENKRVMEAFGRSAELTSGYKWWILLTVIVLGIIGAVISAVVLALGLVIGVPTQQDLLLEGATTLPMILYALANGIATAFSTLINASGIAAIYYELREIKEGVTAGSLAAVFD